MKHLPEVTVLDTYADAVVASGGLDAVFVPLITALDWGVITPPVPFHQTRVINMPDAEVARGRPKYAIPGIAISPDESLSPVETTRLVLRESFKAIRNFNQMSSDSMKTVGVTALGLGLDKLSAAEAVKLLTEACGSFSPVSESSDTRPNHQHQSRLTA